MTERERERESGKSVLAARLDDNDDDDNDDTGLTTTTLLKRLTLQLSDITYFHHSTPENIDVF